MASSSSSSSSCSPSSCSPPSSPCSSLSSSTPNHNTKEGALEPPPKKRRLTQKNQIHKLYVEVESLEIVKSSTHFGPSSEKDYHTIRRNTLLLVRLDRKDIVAKGLLLKNVLPKDKVEALANLLWKNKNTKGWWESKLDTRRSPSSNIRKNYVRTGFWHQVGHATPKYGPFEAGTAGKDPEIRDCLNSFLLPLAEITSQKLAKFDPFITELVAGLPNFPFGSFHLFMCTRGSSAFHRDPNDYVAFLFPIFVEQGKKGALEIGRVSRGFYWQVGDGILLNSRDLEHGTRNYEGNEDNRMIGIFLIQHPYLNVHGIDLKKEQSKKK